MRRFNTEGPVRLDDHYGIPPLERIDANHVFELIRDKRYFVLHAPRLDPPRCKRRSRHFCTWRKDTPLKGDHDDRSSLLHAP